MPRAPFVVFNRPRFHSSPKWHSAVSLQSASRSLPTPCTLPSAGKVGVRARRKKSPLRNGKYCYLTHLRRRLPSETKWLPWCMLSRSPLTLFRCLRTPFSKCFPNAPPQRLLSFADRCVRRGTRLIRLRALHGRNCLLATEYWLPRSKKPRAPSLSLVKWSRRTRLFFTRNARQPRGDSLPGAWLF